MLWSDNTRSPITVCTRKDLQTFTHIVYLNTDAELIAHRRRNEPSKQRGTLSTRKLRVWQKAEKADLRDACYRNGILFTALITENVHLFGRQKGFAILLKPDWL